MSVAIRYASPRMRSMIMKGNEPLWITNHSRAGYVRQSYLATLPWVDRQEMRWLDWCRRAWNAATGTEHVLDHIIPITHSHVCGLTVPWNFRLVPRAVNANKGGKWCESQLELTL